MKPFSKVAKGHISLSVGRLLANEIAQRFSNPKSDRVKCVRAIIKIIKRTKLKEDHSSAGLGSLDIISMSIWGSAKKAATSEPLKDLLEVVHLCEMKRVGMPLVEIKQKKLARLLTGKKDATIVADLSKVNKSLARAFKDITPLDVSSLYITPAPPNHSSPSD